MKHRPKRSPVLDEAALRRQVESLRQDVRRLKIERELLKQAHEILKMGPTLTCIGWQTKIRLCWLKRCTGSMNCQNCFLLLALLEARIFTIVPG
jgi:hypothetical protein